VLHGWLEARWPHHRVGGDPLHDGSTADEDPHALDGEGPAIDREHIAAGRNRHPPSPARRFGAWRRQRPRIVRQASASGTKWSATIDHRLLVRDWNSHDLSRSSGLTPNVHRLDHNRLDPRPGSTDMERKAERTGTKLGPGYRLREPRT